MMLPSPHSGWTSGSDFRCIQLKNVGERVETVTGLKNEIVITQSVQ
jgi:hypothetical protein